MSRRTRISLLLVLALLLTLWLLRDRPPEPAPITEPLPPARSEPRPEAPKAPRPAPRSSSPPAPTQTLERCIPSAAQRCREGDVWLLDSCGRPEEKLDECEARACVDDECEPAPTSLCLDPSEMALRRRRGSALPRRPRHLDRLRGEGPTLWARTGGRHLQAADPCRAAL